MDYIDLNYYICDVVQAHTPEEGTEEVAETLSISGQPPPPTRLDFELFISGLSAQFVKLSAAQVDREIENALDKVRALLGADRCGLFTVFPETGDVQLTHDSRADGIPAPSTRVGYASLFPWSTSRFLRRAQARQIHTRDFPPEASVDRASAESIGTKSFLLVPLLSEGGVRHAILSAAVRQEKAWPEECIPRLRIIGDIFVNTLERKQAEESLRDSLEFERMISELSARFVNLPPGAVDREIEDSLSKVRELFDVDRCSLYAVFPETGEALLTHANHGEGVSPCPAIVDFARAFPWTAKRLHHREIVNLHTRDFPPEAAVDRASSESMGIKSTLRIPVLSGNTVRHVIVVSNVTKEKAWAQEYIPRLRLVGEIFANALERKRADESLRRNLEFEALVSDLSARFVKAPPGEVDRAIADALDKVRAFLAVDRCGLLRVDPETGVFHLLDESRAGGMPPNPLQIDYVGLFPWGADRLIRRTEVIRLHTRDYPPEAAVDRASAEAMGVKSFLSVPIVSGGAVRYVMVSAVGREERVWPDGYIPRLRLVGEIFMNALERKRADESLRETLAFERLISELSARFVDIPIGEVDREVERGLKQVRTFFDVGRCGLFESLPEIGAFRLTHSSLADGLPVLPREIDYFRIFPWRAEGLFGGEKGLLQQTRDYPPEAVVDRASAEAMGIKTSLVIPLSYHGEVGHMIAIHSVREEQNWPEEYVPRFRLVGEILVNALERKRADESLRLTLEEAQQLRDRLQLENVCLREQLRPEDGPVNIVGESDVVRAMLAQARRVAPTDSTVLITGETGTGKELLAQAIHDMSGRGGRAMVTVNCAALPPALIESELFGREKGAFTGATTRQIGRIEVADGSTLFLDEIGDFPVDLQMKLLRVLEDGRFERLGSHRTLTADVRVIAATHRDLGAMVRGGRFREDLFHRLDVYPIHVPPLRARVSDIPRLVWKFVQEFNRKMGKSVDTIANGTMARLSHYPWPGNIRELRNCIERAMIGCDGPLLAIDLPSGDPGISSAAVTMEDAERKHIREALERAHWRIRGMRGAAETLGLPPTTLHSRMKKLGILRPKR